MVDGIKTEQELCKELYEWMAEQDLDYIREVHSENAVIQRIREQHQDQWEIVEKCREILFINSKRVERLLGDIEHERSEAKKFK